MESAAAATAATASTSSINHPKTPLKRHEKRAELVQELSSKDSFRVRDRKRITSLEQQLGVGGATKATTQKDDKGGSDATTKLKRPERKASSSSLITTTTTTVEGGKDQQHQETEQQQVDSPQKQHIPEYDEDASERSLSVMDVTLDDSSHSLRKGAGHTHSHKHTKSPPKKKHEKDSSERAQGKSPSRKGAAKSKRRKSPNRTNAFVHGSSTVVTSDTAAAAAGERTTKGKGTKKYTTTDVEPPPSYTTYTAAMSMDAEIAWEGADWGHAKAEGSSSKPDHCKKHHSIADFLSRDAKVSQTKANREEEKRKQQEQHHDSLPSLDDFSVDFSTESSITDGAHSLEQHKPVKSTASSTSHWKEKAEILGSLDAIADDSSHSDTDDKNYNKDVKARDSLDVIRLRDTDVFEDSPNGSPMSVSMHLLGRHSFHDDIVERLASSMPNLKYYGGSEPMKKAYTDIFLDDSDDNSTDSQDLPDLESLADDKRLDVMSEIADQMEESQQQPNASTTRRSSIEENDFSPSLVSKFSILFPNRSSPVETRGARRDFTSPRKEILGKEKGNDRGPRKPMRRADSFDDDDNDAGMVFQIPEESDVSESSNSSEQLDCSMSLDQLRDHSARQSASELESGSASAPVAYSATSMEFRRTGNQGWIQKTPELMSNSAPAVQYESTQEDALDLPARSASMTDFSGTGRWDNEKSSSKGDVPPSLSRQPRHSADTTSTEELSPSRDRESMRQTFSLPIEKTPGVKSLERSYLPVSLQSAAKKRTGKHTGGEKRSLGMSKRHPSSSPVAASSNASSSVDHTKEISVETGLSEMFEMIGELEEDLVKLENKQAFLRAQRARMAELQSSHVKKDETEGTDADC